LLPVLLYVPFFHEPFISDEGFYASTAQSILDGGVPYRDAFDNKPPLIFGWYALSFLIFGQHLWAPRLLVSLVLALTTLLVYFEGRLIFSHRAGLLAAGGFALSIGLAEFETNANTEYFMLLPMVGALVAFTMGQRRGRLPWYLLAGFLSGLAIMTKEVSLFSFALLLAFALVPALRERRWKTLLLGPGGALVLGCGTALLATALPFLVVGAFGDFFDAVVRYAWQWSGNLPLDDRISNALRAPLYLSLVAGPWVLASILGILFTIRDRPEGKTWLLVGWLLASAIGAASPGRFYDHYYVQLLPAMGLLIPAGAYFLRKRWRQQSVRAAAYLLLAVSLFFAVGFNANIYLQPSYAARHEAKYPDHPRALWETQSPDLAAYVRQRTDDDEYIYNLGFQSELYFYARRKSPTRFVFSRPFEVDKGLVPRAVAELERSKPVYIIDSTRYETWRERRYYPPEIQAFIAEHYDYLGKIYYADVYRLRDSKRH
jgi:4-amino-4-deoxy-L-arabinose transferase-like glycosyltransferase